MKQKNLDEITKTFYWLGWILAASFLLLFSIEHTKFLSLTSTLPPCAFYAVTGHYCPGCGGTRAVVSLINGHILTSISYHPIVLFTAVWYSIFLFRNTLFLFLKSKVFSSNMKEPQHLRLFQKPMKFRISYVYMGLFILIVQWIAKNILQRPYLF